MSVGQEQRRQFTFTGVLNNDCKRALHDRAVLQVLGATEANGWEMSQMWKNPSTTASIVRQLFFADSLSGFQFQEKVNCSLTLLSVLLLSSFKH